MKRRPALMALVLVLAGCVEASAAQRGASPPPAPSGDTARLVWSAFECSVYAEIAGEGEEEQKRLFALGYDKGS